MWRSHGWFDDGVYCWNNSMLHWSRRNRKSIPLLDDWSRSRALRPHSLRGAKPGNYHTERVPAELAAPQTYRRTGQPRKRRFSQEHLDTIAAEIATRRAVYTGPATCGAPDVVAVITCDGCARRVDSHWTLHRTLVCGGLRLGDFILRFCVPCANQFDDDDADDSTGIDIRELSLTFHRKGRHQR